MTTLHRWWDKELSKEQMTLDGIIAKIKEYHTLGKALRENKEAKEIFDRNSPEFKKSEEDTINRINQHGFFKALLRTDNNPYDILDIELLMEVENKSLITVGYIDNECRPSATNRRRWDINNPLFPFRKVHIPIEKIKDFIPEVVRSFYIVRSPIHDEGISLVISGEDIVESYNNGKIVRNYPTKQGLRDFILVERDKGVSGSFNTILNFIIKKLSKKNNFVLKKFILWSR